MFKDIGKMMKMAGQLKSKLPEMQEKMAASEFAAGVEGGAVTVTVNGRLKVTGVRIDPELLADEATDAEMLEDLVTAAAAAAQDKAAEAMRETMRELTGGVDIPGLTDVL
ncbi:MAG: YbaB/EbfC family nucleoid-associated protein [Planctomycetota bacterium]